MDLNTDHREVEYQGRDKWSENVRFRNWLRQKNPAEVFAVVDKIGKQVAAAIDCTTCAKCCNALTIAPQSTDIRRLAEHLKLETYEFKNKYLKKDHEGDLVIKQRPCPFLKGRCCSVYEARPETCRSYPHLEQSHMAGRGWYIVENTLICPIVYNTYEMLKDYFDFWNKKSARDL